MDSSQVIGPILLQRTCDAGQQEFPEDHADKIARRLKGEPAGYFGCGTIFRWWWGMQCLCPGCGVLYQTKITDIKFYALEPTAKQDNDQDDQ